MLAVIGLGIRFASVKDTDAFDYHLYRNQSVPLVKQDSFGPVLTDAERVIEQLLTVNHLSGDDIHLLIVDEDKSFIQKNTTNTVNIKLSSVLQPLLSSTDFFSVSTVSSITEALKTAQEVSFVTNADNDKLNYPHSLKRNISNVNSKAVIILSINQQHLDGVTALLVCDKVLLEQPLSQFHLCHCYAEINAFSALNYTKKTFDVEVSEHIQDFLSTNDINCNEVESVITGEFTAQEYISDPKKYYQHQHQSNWFNAFQSLSKQQVRTSSSQNEATIVNQAKTTLLTSVECIRTDSANFNTLVSLVAAILCLDQRYRLGCKQSLVQKQNKKQCVKETNSQAPSVNDWQHSAFYYLGYSSSYLSNKANDASITRPRRVIVSHIDYVSDLKVVNATNTNTANRDCTTKYGAINTGKVDENINLNQLHQLFSVSAINAKEGENFNVNNGFLAQHALKPVIFRASNMPLLLKFLKQTLSQATDLNSSGQTCSFVEFVKQKNNLANLSNVQVDLQDKNQSNHHLTMGEGAQMQFCVVLLASSFTTLAQQIQLALAGVSVAQQNNKPWKTPVGSYFSGQAVSFCKAKKPLSFIYPGVGALYVNMGKDLLRLFPQCWQSLSRLSDDLAHSLQDTLLTPRLIDEVDLEMSSALEKSLRSELANIAEAGVSYGCLLTNVFQQQLGLKATSAAGYSMGEVSMFAALDCWETPQLMSQRFRNSEVFTEQLSGPLKRLQRIQINSPDKIIKNSVSLKPEQALWESYHLKAGLLQVESIIDEFPRVYITIINTPESLVIAGVPEQCLALAKRLNLRAIALNVHNIIHCELAKSEYENMLQLYSLPIKQKISCQLFSSSCYLPIPITEKAIAVSISKCLTELVDFPRLIKKIAASGETVFIEMGAGKSLSTWIERILKKSSQPITCLSVNQKKLDDHSAILKSIAALLSLGYPIHLQPFFSGSLIRPVKKLPALVSVS